MHALVFLHLLAASLYVGAVAATLLIERRLLGPSSPMATPDVLSVVRTLGRLTSAGIAVLFVTGLVALVARGWLSSLSTQVWLHVMITAALVSAALDGVAGGMTRRARDRLLQDGGAAVAALLARAHRLRWLGAAAGIVALASSVWRWRVG
ncbi:MAG: hypothetical protein AAB426_02100 [Myxococcota bacterium]|mgnify:CR=1 FL=1